MNAYTIPATGVTEHPIGPDRPCRCGTQAVSALVVQWAGAGVEEFWYCQTHHDEFLSGPWIIR